MTLLPTPAAGNFNDSEDPESWLARRDELKAKGINGNGAGTPPAVAVKMLPTPTAHIATRGHSNPELGDRRMAEGRRNLDDVNRWGDYAEAISGWEAVIGRSAPAPLDGKRLSSAFVEWMMDFPEGWCDTFDGGMSRTAKLRCLGNAVVPRQAEAALSLLLRRREVPA